MLCGLGVSWFRLPEISVAAVNSGTYQTNFRYSSLFVFEHRFALADRTNLSGNADPKRFQVLNRGFIWLRNC